MRCPLTAGTRDRKVFAHGEENQPKENHFNAAIPGLLQFQPRATNEEGAVKDFLACCTDEEILPRKSLCVLQCSS